MSKSAIAKNLAPFNFCWSQKNNILTQDFKDKQQTVSIPTIYLETTNSDQPLDTLHIYR